MFLFIILKLKEWFDDYQDNVVNHNYVGQDDCDMKCSYHRMPDWITDYLFF